MKIVISLLVSIALTVSLVGVVAHTDRAAGASGCGLPNPAFCDTFDAPAGTGTRAGDLAPVWGVSRATQNTNGFGNQLQAWVPTTVDLCGTMTAAVPPADVRICNGQLREASSDGGAVTVLAAYPKQPFDFAGRTGKIVFDVSDDTEGTHGSWPELWVTDKPVPAPFQHFTHDFGAPQNAFGIRFGLECNNAAGTGVDSAVVVNNYAVNDSAFGGSLPVTIDGCVTKGVTNGGLNHFEVWVSQAQIDVYGTGPGGGALVHLATIAANLSFTKGLVWIEDVHYNAVKAREPCGCGTQKTHTFTWDNVGFDGPFTYRDLSYDVLDHLVPGDAAQDGHATVNLGWKGTSTDAVSVQTLPMAASEIAAATKAFLLFDLTVYDAPLTISYTINGHPYSAAWPFPGDTRTYLTHTTFVPVTLTDLVPGPQAITISTGTLIVVSQVNIVLVAAGSPGAAPVPTSPPNATPIATPIATATQAAVTTALGTWENVTPPGVSLDFNNPPSNYGTQSIGLSPAAPRTVYVGTAYQGLWKSVDSGASWAQVSTGRNGPNLSTGRNWTLAVDPTDPNTLYTVAGFGAGQGLWKSTTGGVDWDQLLPPATLSATSADVYSVAIDPADHQHLLLGFHNGWAGGPDAGVLESRDGGTSWIEHPPRSGWGTGHYVFFISSSTWLLATQGNGYWRTTDSGASWTQVSTVNMQHGASQLYRAANGTLYVGALHTLLRSTDGGASWKEAPFKAPLSPLTWVLWSADWTPTAEGAYRIMARATDGTGTLQDSHSAASYPSGASGYHTIHVDISK